MRAALIERVMCDLAVDITMRSVVPASSTAGSGLQSLAKLEEDLSRDGLIRFDGSRVLLPEDARLFVRKVAATFDAHLDQSPRQFSRAV